MANVIITFKVMPNDTDVNIDRLKDKVLDIIENYGGEVGKAEIEPIGFGLNCVKVVFLMDESKGDTEPLENKLKELDEVSNVEVTDVRRSLG